MVKENKFEGLSFIFLNVCFIQADVVVCTVIQDKGVLEKTGALGIELANTGGDSVTKVN